MNSLREFKSNIKVPNKSILQLLIPVVFIIGALHCIYTENLDVALLFLIVAVVSTFFVSIVFPIKTKQKKG